jgi:hypothetical protein
MPHNNMPHNNMQGGMFGPMGGSQNIGGMGQMSERELAMMLAGMQGNSPTGGRLPNYATAGPPPPSQVPGIGTTGIDPSMMRNTVGGGLDGVNMNAPSNPLGPMEDAIMNFGQRQLEEERLKRLFAGAGGSSMGGSGYMNIPGMQGPRLPTGG